MYKRIIYLIIPLILICGACSEQNEKPIKFVGISFNQEGFDTLTFPSFINNEMISTFKWKLKNRNGKIIEVGDFSNGIKVNNWSYYESTGMDSLNVFWNQIEMDSFLITYPNGWDIKKNNNNSDLILFNNNSNDMFKVETFVLSDSITGSLELLKRRIRNNLKKYDFNKHFTFRFNIDSKYCIISTLNLSKSNSNLNEILLIGEKGGRIYLFTYITRNHSLNWKNYTYLFEIFRNFKVNNEFIFPYWGYSFYMEKAKSTK